MVFYKTGKIEKKTLRKMARIHCIVTIVIFLWSIDGGYAFSQGRSSEPTVAVKTQAWVHGKKIYLEDIAEINGPKGLQQRLGKTFLALSPDPGKSKTLTGSWISAKIRSAGQVSSDVSVAMPQYVRVGRNYQVVDEETLEQHYVDYVENRLQGSKADFRVNRFRVTGNRPLPEGDIRIELIAERKKELAGNVRLNAEVWVDGNVERKLVLSGWIDRFEDVVCVCTPMARHTVITEQDITLERRNVARLSENVLKDIHGIVGKRVKHAIKPGDVLTASSIEHPPIIERGDRVNILAESSTLIITVPGIAQGKGSHGDIIRVRNLSSKKEVIGAIVDSKTVRVTF
jgi:flagella basal body P-ring formation protein FlgA